MKKMKDKELQLLSKLCREHNLPMKMVNELLKSANKFSYENTTDAVRLKDYTGLIDFYSKDIKGE
ncbi:DNA modification system-associated small protein [Paenibacillus sp. sgz500958]|uniref:DNA modification system-associated small protein n=1 Tax=Paenibacillus sp. sgz500958 TaxID=3242475 RepID=UPI0036D345A1